jgi:hypothetical protein
VALLISNAPEIIICPRPEGVNLTSLDLVAAASDSGTKLNCGYSANQHEAGPATLRIGGMCFLPFDQNNCIVAVVDTALFRDWGGQDV